MEVANKQPEVDAAPILQSPATSLVGKMRQVSSDLSRRIAGMAEIREGYLATLRAPTLEEMQRQVQSLVNGVPRVEEGKVGQFSVIEEGKDVNVNYASRKDGAPFLVDIQEKEAGRPVKRLIIVFSSELKRYFFTIQQNGKPGDIHGIEYDGEYSMPRNIENVTPALLVREVIEHRLEHLMATSRDKGWYDQIEMVLRDIDSIDPGALNSRYGDLLGLQ